MVNKHEVKKLQTSKGTYYKPCWHSIMRVIELQYEKPTDCARERNVAKHTKKIRSIIATYSALKHCTVLTASGKTVPNILS